MNTTPHFSDTALQAAVDRALQQQPKVALTPEFAARVRAALPARPPVQKAYSRGRTFAMLAGGALLVAVFCIAPHMSANFNSLPFDIEVSLLAELAGVAIWLSRMQRGA